MRDSAYTNQLTDDVDIKDWLEVTTLGLEEREHNLTEALDLFERSAVGLRLMIVRIRRSSAGETATYNIELKRL